MLCSVTTQPLHSYEDESDMAKYVDELAMLEELRALPILSLEELSVSLLMTAATARCVAQL